MGQDSRLESAAWYTLVAMAFFAPFSLPAARATIGVAAILVLAGVATRRIRFCMPAVAWWSVAWIVLAVIVTVFGLNPDEGVPRLPKLLWFLSVPVVATLVTSPRRLRILTVAFAIGGVVLAAYMLVLNPILAARSFKAGGFETYGQAVIFHGSMTNGQRFVATIAATLLLAMAMRGRFRAQSGWWAALGVQFAGFVLNFKRGSWAVAAVVMGALAWARWRWRAAVAFVVLAAILLALPPVRHRLGQLRSELDSSGGGRLTMWTKIAPALIAEHPFGIGVRAMTSEMMVAIAPNVEKERNHLHSNVAQVLVETGWLGFAIYLGWMAVALRDAWRMGGGRRGWPPGGDADRWLPLLALAGLMLNGLVEYNMGDAGIVLLYGLFMGVAAAGAKWDDTPRHEGPAPTATTEGTERV